jgi:hypothetical protein
MHGNTVYGTREALHLAWPCCQVRTVHPRGTTVMHGCKESDRFIGPRKPSNKGGPKEPAEKVEGRERAKGNVAAHTRDRTQGRGTPVTRARPRTAGTFGCSHVRPEAGARCGSAARRDLCGGCWVTSVPTANTTMDCGDKSCYNT